MKVYENKWCEVIYSGGWYILRSKTGKYSDVKFKTLTEAIQKTL